MKVENVRYETHLIYGDVVYKRIENKETGSFDWYLKDELITNKYLIESLNLALIYNKRNILNK